MKYEDMRKTILNLEFDKKKVICTDIDGVEVYVIRPSVLPKRFKDYDVKKNFQIWIKEKDREFRPNHLRVLIDLNLRTRSRPDLKRKLLQAFDNVFYGQDPEAELNKLGEERFEHFLNNIEIILTLAQLFLIEQEINYLKESQFDPGNLFLQGWIREFIDNPKEIDNLCMSVANRQPPKIKYTYKENKKHKKYDKDFKSLWYFED
ncbi:hypothetical protein KY338_04990 [Candidatus Woesearchaeota archaeon]|nr:hypothetical protein [Candidatus Woesearchaeota archaeon]MBW3005844.1 hypothetical protein [Candidatus Woesearchaeota archaeon]